MRDKGTPSVVLCALCCCVLLHGTNVNARRRLLNARLSLLLVKHRHLLTQSGAACRLCSSQHVAEGLLLDAVSPDCKDSSWCWAGTNGDAGALRRARLCAGLRAGVPPASGVLWRCSMCATARCTTSHTAAGAGVSLQCSVNSAPWLLTPTTRAQRHTTLAAGVSGTGWMAESCCCVAECAVSPSVNISWSSCLVKYRCGAASSIVARNNPCLNTCLRYIFSSTVPHVMRRYTTTSLVCPMRYTRSTAWLSSVLHDGSSATPHHDNTTAMPRKQRRHAMRWCCVN